MKTINIQIELENGSSMKAELYPEIAPLTVANFVKLIEQNFYDNLVFHRIIAGFMVQGGGFDAEGNHKPADSIKGEFKSNGIENNLKHTKGVLSMARAMAKDSASSQFFIMHADSPHLDGEYAAFGKVTEGLDVIDALASVPTDMRDVPYEVQMIKTIRLL